MYKVEDSNELDVTEELRKIGVINYVDTNRKVFDVRCKDIVDDCRRIQQYNGACNHIYVDLFLHRSAEECFWKNPVENLMELITYFNNGGM